MEMFEYLVLAFIAIFAMGVMYLLRGKDVELQSRVKIINDRIKRLDERLNDRIDMSSRSIEWLLPLAYSKYKSQIELVGRTDYGDSYGSFEMLIWDDKIQVGFRNKDREPLDPRWDGFPKPRSLSEVMKKAKELERIKDRLCCNKKSAKKDK